MEIVESALQYIPGKISPVVTTGQFGDHCVALKFTTGKSSTKLGRINMAEEIGPGGGPGFRVASIATEPGLVSLDGSAVPGVLLNRSGIGINLPFGVGSRPRGAMVQLEPDTTYWCNIVNWDMSGGQPGNGGSLRVDLKAP